MKKLRSRAEWLDRAKEVHRGARFGNFDADFILFTGSGGTVWDEDRQEFSTY